MLWFKKTRLQIGNEGPVAYHLRARRLARARSALPPRPELRRRIALSMKLAEQRLSLSKVACVKTFGEPIVGGGEKVTCRLPFSLIAQEPRQAHGRAQFPRLCLLCSRNGQGMLEIRLGFRHVPLRRLECDFTSNAMSLSLTPPFLGC